MRDPIDVVRQLSDAELSRYGRILAAKIAVGLGTDGTRPAFSAIRAVLAERGMPAPIAGSLIHDERFRWTGRHHWGRRRMRPGDHPEPPLAA